jgi:hypothetical protein
MCDLDMNVKLEIPNNHYSVLWILCCFRVSDIRSYFSIKAYTSRYQHNMYNFNYFWNFQITFFQYWRNNTHVHACILPATMVQSRQERQTRQLRPRLENLVLPTAKGHK